MNRTLAGGALAAAVLLVPALARAVEPEFGGPLPQFDFAAFRPLAAPPPRGTPFMVPDAELGAPTAVVPLGSLLDNLRTTRISFRAGGAVVRVYAEKSRNKGDWFVVFAAENADPQFRNGSKMIHWALIKRTVHFSVGGKAFSAYIQGSLSNRMQSRVVVSADDRSQPDASWTIQEITDAAYDAGYPLTLGGRPYRLFYARDFDQTDGGEFAGYTGGRSIVLLARDQNRFTAYHWLESDIPRSGILAVSEKPSFADDENASALLLGLRLSADGRLEIYDRAPRR